MDEDIWGIDDDDDDNKAPTYPPDDDDDDKTNPFSNYGANNHDDDDDDDDVNPLSQTNGNSSIAYPAPQNDDPAQNDLLSYYDVGLDGDSEIRLVSTEERKGRVTTYSVYS